jgi:hypothetical protein
MSDAERQPFTITLGGKSYKIDPLTAGQVRRIAAAMDHTLAHAGSTEAAIESYCMIVRAGLAIKHPQLAESEAFDAAPMTQGELQQAARVVMIAAGYQLREPAAADGVGGDEKKS